MSMKAYRKLLLLLIFGLVCLSLFFLSAKLRVEDGRIIMIVNNLSAEDVPRQGREIGVVQHDLDKQRLTNSYYSRHQKYRLPPNTTYSTQKTQQRQPPWNSTSVRPFSCRASTEQVLEFVHITKTGGTAVEKAGGEAGIKWGVCRFRLRRQCGMGCRGQTWYNKFTLRKNVPVPNFQGEYWHTPPAWFERNPYNGKATFTIVRNPYDRIVSEFYCRYFGFYRDVKSSLILKSRLSKAKSPQILEKPGAADTSKEETNLSEPDSEHLKETSTNLDKVQQNQELKQDRKNKERGRLKPLTVRVFNVWIRGAILNVNLATGHMLPQSYYVFDNVNGTSQKVVDHVLKFESLKEEFAKLMMLYGLKHVKLSPYKPQPLDLAGKQRFTVADLEPSTICFINKRYAQDFKLLGYPTLHVEGGCKNASQYSRPKISHQTTTTGSMQ